MQRLQLIEDAYSVLQEENKRVENQFSLANNHVKDLEAQLRKVHDELEAKNELIEEMERNLSNSCIGERQTFSGTNMLQSQELAETKRMLEEKLKRLTEVD